MIICDKVAMILNSQLVGCSCLLNSLYELDSFFFFFNVSRRKMWGGLDSENSVFWRTALQAGVAWTVSELQ